MRFIMTLEALLSMVSILLFLYAAENGIYIKCGEYYFDFIGFKNMRSK